MYMNSEQLPLVRQQQLLNNFYKNNPLYALEEKLSNPKNWYDAINDFNAKYETFKNKLAQILYYILISPVDVIYRILTHITEMKEQDIKKYGGIMIHINSFIILLKNYDDLQWLTKKKNNIPKFVRIVESSVYLIINSVIENLSSFEKFILQTRNYILTEDEDSKTMFLEMKPMLNHYRDILVKYFDNVSKNPDSELLLTKYSSNEVQTQPQPQHVQDANEFIYNLLSILNEAIKINKPDKKKAHVPEDVFKNRSTSLKLTGFKTSELFIENSNKLLKFIDNILNKDIEDQNNVPEMPNASIIMKMPKVALYLPATTLSLTANYATHVAEWTKITGNVKFMSKVNKIVKEIATNFEKNPKLFDFVFLPLVNYAYDVCINNELNYIIQKGGKMTRKRRLRLHKTARNLKSIKRHTIKRRMHRRRITHRRRI